MHALQERMKRTLACRLSAIECALHARLAQAGTTRLELVVASTTDNVRNARRVPVVNLKLKHVLLPLIEFVLLVRLVELESTNNQHVQRLLIVSVGLVPHALQG